MCHFYFVLLLQNWDGCSFNCCRSGHFLSFAAGFDFLRPFLYAFVPGLKRGAATLPDHYRTPFPGAIFLLRFTFCIRRGIPA